MLLVSISSVNAMIPSDMLAGMLGVYIIIKVAIIVPVVRERVKKLCSTVALIVVIKNATSRSMRARTVGIQIHSPPMTTTIL